MRLAQKGVWHRVWLVLFALACLAGPALLRPGAARATGPIYVKWNAMGARDGSSWANAYTTLQAALSVARSGEEIWVAAGIYRPPLRTSTFRLVNGAALYGGFVGNETAREQRDWAAHVTTLSGELGAAGDPSDNCYHVIDGSSTQTNTVLDGFVVTGGNANGAWFYANGGGLYVIQGSPTVRNVIFRGNAANALGGGLYSSDGSPTLINVVFSGNHAGTSGGGMYAAKDTPILINATFSGNSAGANGGGFYSRYVGSPTLANCILWGNTAPDGAQLASANDSSPTVIYSLVQGGYPGSDALDEDPLFVRNPNPAAGDYGDLRLGPGSPAIDAGDNDTVAGIATDLACNPRLIGARVDMGAYEAASNGPPAARSAARFSSASYQRAEGSSPATISVTLSAASNLTVTVVYTTTGGSATPDEDYTPVSGTLTLVPGETSASFDVVIAGDAVNEVDETVMFALSDPTNATLGTPSTATLTILDDDAPTTLAAISPRAATAGGVEFTLLVTGTQFFDGLSLIYWNGAARPTGFINSEHLTASIPAADIAATGLASVTVANAWGGGIGSNALEFIINAPPVAVDPPANPGDLVTVTVDTPAGTVEATFQGVAEGGTLTVEVSHDAPGSPPGGYTLLGTHYQVSAEGVTYSGVTLCLPYSDAEVAAAGVPELSLRLLHYESGAWRDVTTSLDTLNNRICGEVSTLLPFVIGVLDLPSCAFTVNSGALYTNKREVQLFSDTGGAAEMLVSNDAGFSGATWQTYRSSLPWMVSDPGQRIVTFIVYMRLRGAGGSPLCSGLSLIDDIIYDPLPPTLDFSIAQVGVGPSGGLLLRAASNQVTLHLAGADQEGGSGLAGMQVSTRSDFAGAPWQPWATTMQLAAEPGQTVYARARDGVGNVSGVVSRVVPGAVALVPGWNLLSLPLAPANTAITQALSSIAGHYDLAYTYDALDAANHWKKFNVSAPPFLNTLSQLDETQGLWIRITSAVPFTMTGTPPASPSIPLKQGWNLVGYPSQTARPIVEALASIAGKYDLVYAYDAYATNPWKKYNVSAPPFLNTLAEMGPGLGYWIRATQDCTWQLP